VMMTRCDKCGMTTQTLDGFPITTVTVDGPISTPTPGRGEIHTGQYRKYHFCNECMKFVLPALTAPRVGKVE
jgi:hypothetical protein